MKFVDPISFLNRAPDGWREKLTLGQFDKLDEERKRYYHPLYAKYRTKKIRDYDPDYGKFVGWKPIEVGIGKPIGYKYVGYISARMIDQLYSSNILMDRVLNKRNKWG